jgi:hypothetical protein
VAKKDKLIAKLEKRLAEAESRLSKADKLLKKLKPSEEPEAVSTDMAKVGSGEQTQAKPAKAKRPAKGVGGTVVAKSTGTQAAETESE